MTKWMRARARVADYEHGDRVVVTLHSRDPREMRGTVRDVTSSSSWVERVVDLDDPTTLQGKCIGIPFCKTIRFLNAVDWLGELA